jgi:hypothetical protein
MASTTDVIEALKYTYGVDQVLYLVNQEVVCWNMFQKMKKPLGGRGQFLMPIMVKNPGAWTGLAEGGALPSNSTRYDRGVLQPHRICGAVQHVVEAPSGCAELEVCVPDCPEDDGGRFPSSCPEAHQCRSDF